MLEVSFGEWLKRQRSGRGMTQEQLAQEIGCAAITLRKIESEERRPSAQIVKRLVEIFNIPPNEQTLFLRFARGDWKSAPSVESEDSPWRASIAFPRSNLPASLTSIIGRDSDIAVVREYLSNFDIRLVTLLGPPGIGKTRLSLEVARKALQDFHDGAFFVALAPLEDPNLVALTIVQALGFVETPNQSSVERLQDGIGDKQMLIVLDNIEHLIYASAKNSYTLLDQASELNILASSREALGVKGEMIWHVPSLSLPDMNHLPDLDELVQFEAIRLFTERATLAKPNFRATKENASFIAQICSRLDGIPLAIELAAARIKALSLEQISARLDDRFRLLTGGSRTALPRQQTLRATIDWSYNLLTEEEKKLLHHLTVFAGGWTLEAAESVCSEEGMVPVGESRFDILDLLTQLVDKSLVIAQDSRYRMLETTRQYAREKLLDSGEEQAMHDRHLSYFLDLAKQADQEIHGHHQVEWLDRLETEHENYRAALDWCISTNHTESALYLIGSFSDLGRFWSVQSYFSEARNWFDKVQTLPDVTLYPIAYATALNGMSFIGFLQGDFGFSRATAEESQHICEGLGTAGELGLAGALLAIGLSTLTFGDGEITRMEACYRQATAIYQAHGNPWELALAWLRLGVTARVRKSYGSARAFLEDSLSIFHEFDDAFGLGRVYREMGYLFTSQGEYDQARRMYEQGLHYDKKLHFQHAVSSSFFALGNICRILGEYDQSEGHFFESLRISREYNLGEDNTMPFYLGCIMLHRGSYVTAKINFIHFITMNHKLGDHPQVGDGLLALAASVAGLHQYEYAARLAGAGQAIHNAIEWEMEGIDRIEIDPLLQIAREQLGDTKFEALAAEGRAMTMEQAVAFALQE